MKTSKEILRYQANFATKSTTMTFVQLHQIIGLADELGKYNEAREWLGDFLRTREEAEDYIERMCIELDRPEVRCIECKWHGAESELILKTFRNGGGDENICPNCKAQSRYLVFYNDIDCIKK